MPFFDQYPYTNFHNVNLDWVLERVKEWGRVVEDNNTRFENLEQANEDFKEYVTTYLENLDVQAAIDDKLDRMFETGLLVEYFEPYISRSVTSWLDDNITEPEGIIIDSSLTVSGAAADSKTVGDKLLPVYDNFFTYENTVNNIVSDLTSLLNSKRTITETIIKGFDSLNATEISFASTPFVYRTYNFNHNIYIYGIRANFVNTGVFTIGKILKSKVNIGVTGDVGDFIYIEHYNVTSTGTVSIIFDTPIEITPEYYLSIGKRDDTAKWYYGSHGIDKGFTFISPSTGKWVDYPGSASLGINIVAITTSVIYRSTLNSVLSNKKVSFYGDSITTFAGFIPTGYATYYPRDTIDNVSDTWWYKVINALNLTLDINNSWSGCRVAGSANSAGTNDDRINNLGTPDIIIIFMGINDFNNEVALGDYDGKSQIPETVSTFANAYTVMLNKILSRYKTSKVYVCTLTQCEKNEGSEFPELNSNGNSLTEFNDMIKKIANYFNVDILDIAKCGITYQNLDVYTQDNLHPNVNGHSLIANYIIEKLDNAVITRY